MILNWNRILSSLVAVVCIVEGSWTGGAKGGFIVTLFVILPLAFIWSSDAVSDVRLSGNQWISLAAPSAFIRLVGWLVLILPLFLIVL